VGERTKALLKKAVNEGGESSERTIAYYLAI